MSQTHPQLHEQAKKKCYSHFVGGSSLVTNAALGLSGCMTTESVWIRS